MGRVSIAARGWRALGPRCRAPREVSPRVVDNRLSRRAHLRISILASMSQILPSKRLICTVLVVARVVRSAEGPLKAVAAMTREANIVIKIVLPISRRRGKRDWLF